MTDLKIIPQKFSFEEPTITNANEEVIQYGINVSIEIDAFKADKQQVKQDLSSIFAEVLEYFD